MSAQQSKYIVGKVEKILSGDTFQMCTNEGYNKISIYNMPTL